ncbi:MAG: hypothetical protein HY518_04580 [Candidatus Aenigmarchaeota archaeon]|nr:hypothetical protein [Candidatus Aenigmarchaeota archaeon]
MSSQKAQMALLIVLTGVVSAFITKILDTASASESGFFLQFLMVVMFFFAVYIALMLMDFEKY